MNIPREQQRTLECSSTSGEDKWQIDWELSNPRIRLEQPFSPFQRRLAGDILEQLPVDGDLVAPNQHRCKSDAFDFGKP